MGYQIKSGIFGYHMFGFHPLFRLCEDGIEYKGNLIPWSLITKVEDFDFYLPGYNGRMHETYLKIYFNGGSIKIDVTIVQKEDIISFFHGYKRFQYSTAAYEFLNIFICNRVDSNKYFKGETFNERLNRISTTGNLRFIDYIFRGIKWIFMIFAICLGLPTLISIVLLLLNLFGLVHL